MLGRGPVRAHCGVVEARGGRWEGSLGAVAPVVLGPVWLGMRKWMSGCSGRGLRAPPDQPPPAPRPELANSRGPPATSSAEGVSPPPPPRQALQPATGPASTQQLSLDFRVLVEDLSSMALPGDLGSGHTECPPAPVPALPSGLPWSPGQPGSACWGHAAC